MRVASAILFIGAVLLFGSGLAALPYAQNEPCLELLTERGPEVRVTSPLLPYGTRCEVGSTSDEFLGPGTGAYAGWLLATALALGGAVATRRSPFASGIASATAVLGLFGLLWHQLEFAGAATGTVVLAVPGVYVIDRLLRAGAGRLTSFALALLLPFGVLAAWFAPGLIGWPVVAVATGALMGAVLSRAAGYFTVKSARMPWE